MKRLCSGVLLIVLLFSLSASVFAAPSETVSVAVFNYQSDRYESTREFRKVALRLNGASLVGDMPAVLLNGRTMAPLRLLAEALGAEVEWVQDTAQVIVRQENRTVVLTLGSHIAYINGTAKPMPDQIPALMMSYRGKGRTMVPLRFFSETLGCKVEWDAPSYTASVSQPGKTDLLLEGLDIPVSPERFLIALDAGHGGSASGAYYEKTAEKDLNLAMTKKLKSILDALGYRTMMTRTGEEGVGLLERAQMANRAQADIFVSIHCNASEDYPNAQGLHVYHYPGSKTGKALAQAIQTPACQFTGAIDRGIASENFAVVRETTMPAVLVETGFMTCHEELLRLKDDAYQTRMARGIAQGIIRYLNANG